MGIIDLISRNFIKRAHTLTPQSLVPFPGGFRGELLHDPARCTACETCAYVCSPTAIHFDYSQPDKVGWQYQMMQCTFCGRCVEFCPTHALSLEQRPAEPLYKLQLTEHFIEYQACTRCGDRFIAMPLVVLEEKYGSPVPPEMLRLHGMCESCRKRAYAENLKKGFTGL